MTKEEIANQLILTDNDDLIQFYFNLLISYVDFSKYETSIYTPAIFINNKYIGDMYEDKYFKKCDIYNSNQIKIHIND